ncbi:MAG: acyltransferase family protein [Bacteroidetes bacterium]|nr:acyltransferase family protein [Bacteroidota bacterium]
MKRNLQHIDEIRFLIIHLILINHWMLSVALIMNSVDKSLIDFWFELTSPTLSLISGYLFFYRTKENFGYIKKVKTRFHSLVVPYLFWSLTFFFIYFIIKKSYLYLFHNSFWYEPVRPMTFGNFIDTIKNPPLINFWYLQNLIFIIPFNFLIYYLLKNRWIFGLIFLAIIGIYAYDYLDIYFSPRFLPFYLLGAFFGYNEIYIPKVNLKFYTARYASSIILVPVLFFITTRTSDLDYTGILTLPYKICIVLFFVITVFNLLDANPDSWVMKYLKKYKDYSFFLFAIHMFFFTVVQRSLLKLGVEHYLLNKYYSLLFNIFSLIIVIIMSFSLARLLKTKVPKFYFLIVGR